MTVPLLNSAPNDAEELVITWLAPLFGAGPLGAGRVAHRRVANDPLPFILVNHITGTEDPCLETADPVVSVHTMTDIGLGDDNLKTQSKIVHRRMLYLAHYQDAFQLADLTWANVDYVTVFQSPIWVSYDDVRILRTVGRYTIGLSYVQLAGYN